MAGRFEDRTVIITGGSAGVGAACARAFAREGANLVLVARGAEALEKVAESLRPDTEVLCVPLDVTDQAGCLALLEEAYARFGRIDVLVNNAGFHKRGPVMGVAPEDLARMIEVNLAAPLFLTRAALPWLERSGGGAIVNVASLAGRAFVPGSAGYSASKFGLRAFSMALAEELRGTGISVSVVSPGPIDTEFILGELEEVTDLTFSQPMSTREEVAEVVLNAAAGDSREIAMPWASGLLTTAAYLFPGLGRALRPALERKGARVKARLKAERDPGRTR